MLRNRTTLAIPLILLGAACSSSPAAIADAAATTDAPVVFDAVHTVDAALTCPPAACHVADLTCLAARSNVGASTFLMSMMQVTYAKPTVLTSGLVAQVFTAGLSPNSPTCGLTGDGLVRLVALRCRPAPARPRAEQANGQYHIKPTLHGKSSESDRD